MTKRDRLFKMLGFPVKLDIAPAVEVVVSETTVEKKKQDKPKAVKRA